MTCSTLSICTVETEEWRTCLWWYIRMFTSQRFDTSSSTFEFYWIAKCFRLQKCVQACSCSLKGCELCSTTKLLQTVESELPDRVHAGTHRWVLGAAGEGNSTLFPTGISISTVKIDVQVPIICSKGSTALPLKSGRQDKSVFVCNSTSTEITKDHCAVLEMDQICEPMVWLTWFI